MAEKSVISEQRKGFCGLRLFSTLEKNNERRGGKRLGHRATNGGLQATNGRDGCGGTRRWSRLKDRALPITSHGTDKRERYIMRGDEGREIVSEKRTR